MNANRIRGWRESAVRTAAAVAAGALAVGLLVVSGVDELESSTASFTGDVALTTDTGGAALFTAEGLAPGKTLSSCVAVSYEGPEIPIELRLHGASNDGSLDDHLTLRVETGAGGGFGDCDGFTGTERYAGTLAGFLDTHGSGNDALLVAVPDPPTQPVTFRFSLLLDGHPDAQGRASSSAYTWTASPVVGTPPPTPPPTDPTEPPTAPTEPPGDPTEPPTDPADPTEPGADPSGPPTDPPGDAEGSLPADPVVPGGAPGQASAPLAAADGVVSRVGGQTWEQILRVLRFVAQRSSYLLLLLLVVLVFLAIQDRIDRKDPKLALAPREPDLDLHFAPPPSERGER